MRIHSLTTLIVVLANLIFTEKTYSAVDQILTDNFFLNPAEYSRIKQIQLIVGNVFIIPTLKFTGTTPLGSGRVKSQIQDSLPYLLTAYRFTDRFVFGVNITPSAYGDIHWPKDSIVSQAGTDTRIFYYRIGTQASYQFTDKLALGVGINLHYNKLAELDVVVPNIGNQINKNTGFNHTVDAGLLYKINSKNYLTLAVYTDVDNFGHGTSSLGPITVHNFSLLFTEAAVAYIGLQHSFNDKWFLEGKIYWSGWKIGKNVYFINKTNGTSIIPANWGDTWSFQLNTRYATTDKIALFGSVIYETNPAPISTNAIGYPLSNSGAISVGVDIALVKKFSSQLAYSYGKFIPNAKIDSGGNRGTISANFQAAVIQFTYKA